MIMPLLNSSKSKISTDIMQFKGIDDSKAAPMEALKNVKNMRGNYPYIETRPPREVVVSGIAAPKALFSSTHLCWVDGDKFVFNGVEKGTVAIGNKSMVDFNGYIVIFPDKKAYDYISDTWVTFDSPDINYAYVWNNRIWGVKEQDIYASELGKFNAWETFEGLASDSWATDVAGNEEFTAIMTYSNHVQISQKDMFYEIYGTKPSDFTVRNVSVVGATNNKAMAEVNSVLYYHHRNGVHAYSGGMPRPIAANITKEYQEGVFGTDMRLLYACLFDGTKYDLFTYDTYRGLWYRDDDLHIIDFTYHDNFLYALANDGNIYKFGSGTERVSWEFETQEFDYKISQRKTINELQIRMEMEPDATADVYISYDGKSYTLLKRITHSPYSNLVNIGLPINSCEKFQLKVVGEAYVLVREIYKSVVTS